MKRTGWVKVTGIIGILILVFMSNYWTIPVKSADFESTPAVGSKVSSLLSLHIQLKQAEYETFLSKYYETLWS